jgi:hypothetical protein
MLKSWQRHIDGVPLEVHLPFGVRVTRHAMMCLLVGCDMCAPWHLQEENFGEAISNAHKLFNPPSIRERLAMLKFLPVCTTSGICKIC